MQESRVSLVLVDEAAPESAPSAQRGPAIVRLPTQLAFLAALAACGLEGLVLVPQLPVRVGYFPEFSVRVSFIRFLAHLPLRRFSLDPLSWLCPRHSLRIAFSAVHWP